MTQSTPTTKALVLFAHGARADAWAKPFRRLHTMLQSQRPDLRVELAFLEFMTPSLPDIAQALEAAGIRHIHLVPIFLGQGGHVMRDLPMMIDEIRLQYPHLNIEKAEAAGEDELVLQAICDYCLRSQSA
ncbi:sirohydrochlorin chelatase [Undibacterium cyanobacteriorum]